MVSVPETAPEPPREAHAIATGPLCLVGVAFVLLEMLPLANSEYGYFIDEFYYYACSDRLAWGYVDHPPLSIFILWLVRSVLGDSLIAVRAVAAIAGATTVFAGGVMAQRMGAGRYGQLLAAIAIACSSLMLAIFGFYSMNAIEVLLWSACSLVLIEILYSDDGRRFWLVGLILGLGALNKHTILLFAGGLAIGMLATRSRAMLKERSLWVGVAIALFVALPNLLWQVEHDWVSLEFYRNAGSKNAPTPALEALLNQVLSFNPGSLPIWGVGAWALLRDRRSRPLGILFCVILLGLVFSGQSRQDRIAGLVPLAMAAGGAWWDRHASARGRVVLVALPVGVALVLAPVVLPILPPAQLSRYASSLGVVPELEAHETALALPQWFADRLDWEPYVRAVEAAYESLPEEEKASAIILTRSYGAASSLELLGRGLPPVHSLHNAYHTWGPPEPFGVAIVVQYSEQELGRYFESVTQVGQFQCTWCRQWRQPTPIHIVRQPKRAIESLWDELRRYL